MVSAVFGNSLSPILKCISPVSGCNRFVSRHSLHCYIDLKVNPTTTAVTVIWFLQKRTEALFNFLYTKI
jgi:hypothetical protein